MNRSKLFSSKKSPECSINKIAPRKKSPRPERLLQTVPYNHFIVCFTLSVIKNAVFPSLQKFMPVTLLYMPECQPLFFCNGRITHVKPFLHLLRRTILIMLYKNFFIVQKTGIFRIMKMRLAFPPDIFFVSEKTRFRPAACVHVPDSAQFQ